MNISGTCEIQVWADAGRHLSGNDLKALRNKLTEEFSNVLDAVLLRDYGIENAQMHGCLVNDLEVKP